MRRLLVIAALAAVGAALVVAWPAAGEDDGPYKVRAYFDNAGFVVEGEEVRIAGARVGTVDAVEITRGDEVVSLEDGGRELPAKAAVVLSIENDGFQDFRADASCIIRPQSLLGEKFVECTPTQPRAHGEPPPPELETIEDGPGEGQRLLPLENNAKAVDLDLIQNLNRLPYRERFRLILNDLGAGLAGRGEDLAEVVERANPALKQTDRVLEILARQNRVLAQLAVDSDTVLEPLARERQSVVGFISNAGVSAEAAAERRDDIEAGLQRFPALLRELRSTMHELRRFADEGTPLFRDLGAVAPDLGRATVNLAPFARAAIPAIRTLGDAAEESGPDLVASDPVIVDLRRLGKQARPLAGNLNKILRTFEQTRGFRYLLDFIRNVTLSQNGYDSIGHFLRTNLLVSNCVAYVLTPGTGCVARFTGRGAIPSVAASSRRRPDSTTAGASDPGTGRSSLELIPEVEDFDDSEAEPEQPSEGETEAPAEGEEETKAPEAQAPITREGLRRRARTGLDIDSTRLLLQFLLGSDL